MSDEPEIINEFIPIPKEFHSFLTDEPFENCSVCDRYLLDDGVVYFIEKAIDKSEIAFEYAMCLPCQMGLETELSEGSIKMIRHYLDEHIEPTRKSRLIEEFGLDHHPWIAGCVICDASWNAAAWKQLVGICDGPDLLFTEWAPLVICGNEAENLYKLLSKKTRDRLDDFVDEVLGNPAGSLDMPPLLV